MARELTLTKASVNIELLDQELRDEFGALTTGLTRRGDTVTVYMTQSITPTQLTTNPEHRHITRFLAKNPPPATARHPPKPKSVNLDVTLPHPSTRPCSPACWEI